MTKRTTTARAKPRSQWARGAARRGVGRLHDAGASGRKCVSSGGKAVDKIGQGIIPEYYLLIRAGFQSMHRQAATGGITLPIRTAEDAAADIGHHFEGLRALGVAVHKDFLEKCRLIAPVLNSSTRASIYRQIFVRMLHDYCDATAGAQLHRKNQLVLVGLANKYLLRVKKLRQGFAVGVSPTYASENYDANRLPEYAADLYPEATNATLLYLGWSVPENAPTEISLYLVCNEVNREVLWVIPITAGDGGRGIQEPLPIGGDDSGVGIRLVAKPGERKENG